MTIIQLTGDARDEARFLDLPGRVHAGDVQYVPAFQAAERAALRDPAHQDCQAAFVVTRNGDAIGRCLARRAAGAAAGSIGWFAAFDDPEACRLLLAAAETWLREQGATHILGPMDGDTWHHYRFTTGPFDTPPFLKEPWNPPWYPALWEACGYTVVDRYLSARIPDPARAAARMAPYLKRVRRQGYTFRPIRMQELARELELLHDLSCRIFEGNRHYRPITRDAFLQLYAGSRPLMVPPLCQFCCAPDGTEAGFVFCYPDLSGAVRAMRGQRGPLALLRFWRRRGRADRVCVKSLGCLPDYRGTGMGPALMALALEQTVACGYGEALMCLMHEDNDSRRLDGGASEVFRHYVLYGKQG